ncbi:MAG TPA: helix-turn-helix domain-containing protein [Candidatus Dormibacteraeota bacterium]|nr:helix-turn-helix domain-containing protein [Candidatus Dormibacteraeota bacterium]
MNEPVSETGGAPGGAAVPAAGGEVGIEELRDLGTLIPGFVRALKCLGPPNLDLAAMLKQGAPHLTSRHITALHALVDGGPLSVGELAARLHIALPTASLLVGDLGRARLVERAEDPGDRRRTIVRVSAEHADGIDEFLRRRIEPARRTLARMTPAVRADFLLGMRILVEEFTAAADCEDG